MSIQNGGTEPKERTSWRTAIATAGLVVGGILASWSGLKSQLDQQRHDLARLEARQQSHERQTTRIEDKVDRLTDAVLKGLP